MSDVREIPAVLEAAAQAASSGDLASAEALLHEVVRLQETSLGPRHADLASTFNNLAVVSEMAGKPEEAEQFYRRAYAIASSVLDPHDPLVTTSLSNLKEFCQARGIATGLAAEARTEPVAVAAPAEVAPIAAPPAPPRQASSQTVVVAGLAAAALLAVLILIWPRGQEPVASPETAATPAVVAPTPSVPPDVPPPAVAPAPPAPPAVATPARAALAPAKASSIRVLEARVCLSLSTDGAEWRCVPPSNPARPGRLYFYTRVAASADVRVRHRWYRGDRLQQDVGLAVRANPGAGYRTYSRLNVDALDGGEWRLEVRTADGALLREEKIAVR